MGNDQVTPLEGQTTLVDLPIGTVTVVRSVAAMPNMQRRLAELGLRRGATVAVLQRCSGGGRVIGIAQARVALDRAALASVSVAICPATDESEH